MLYSIVSETFVEYAPHDPIDPFIKAITFYLPQYHPFPENDEWWGKGFTDWNNVGKARPLFPDPHQPHCPIHLGYYDLRVPEIMREQATLAKNYGVSGFAFCFHWFAGQLLMETPLERILEGPEVNIPFCMIWANENGTRRWDGKDQEILIAQDHSLEDSRAMLQYLQKFMEDPRYTRINRNPLLIVYRSAQIPDFEATTAMWQEEARKIGSEGLYLVSTLTTELEDLSGTGLDAAMEFPPHNSSGLDVTHTLDTLPSNFEGGVFDYDAVAAGQAGKTMPEYRVLRTSMLSWDNTARRRQRTSVFADFSLTRYSQWLAANAEQAAKDDTRSDDERIIFINAWNEWAEGTHLEPDSVYGYGYLEATRRVMENYTTAAAPFLRPKIPDTTTSEYAIVAYVHYGDTWPELIANFSSIDV